MIVKNLSLSDFRKFSKKEFTFSAGTNIIVGPNASGKTNILESLFLLATGKSFRAEESSEMISFEKEIGRVKGEISKYANMQIDKLTDEELELEVMLTRGEVMGVKAPLKKYSINGVAKRMLDFVGNLRVVLFWPQDLELVTDSPSLRRHYLDFVLMQVDREYRRNLHSYEKGLRQRNKVLEAIRDSSAHRHQLLFWDQLLIKGGEYITKKREEYIHFVNKFQISNDKLQIKSKIQDLNYQLVYDSSIISRSRLDQYSEEEVAAANTLVGPHRDDVEFRIKNYELRRGKDTSVKNDPGSQLAGLDPGSKKDSSEAEEYRNLSHFGSRGEQRLGVLWLKLRELAYIEETTDEKPVLLLDDILSELDHEHRKIIFDMIGNQQTIMTTTDMHLLEKTKIKDAKMIELL